MLVFLLGQNSREIHHLLQIVKLSLYPHKFEALFEYSNGELSNGNTLYVHGTRMR